jgi:hypothetical protein
MVREALPAATKEQRRRLRKLEEASAFIDRVLLADQSEPPKQRRIFDRLRAEVRSDIAILTFGKEGFDGFIDSDSNDLRFLGRR